MAENKIRLPSSQGGIVRYGETGYSSDIVWKPEVVVGICIAIIVGIIILNIMF